LRTHREENEEQAIHLMYGFLYVADKYEGLVIVGDPNLKGKSPGVGTLLDGNPANNFLKRAATFNPGGALNGARRITIAGTYAYILCDRGLVVVDLDHPLQPRIVAEIGAPILLQPRGLAIQFRYAFVIDRQGLKVLDVTNLAQPKPVSGALVPLEDARNIYVARTYAYVAAGKQGMAIVDVEHPEQPRLDELFNAGGALNDANDVKLGMVSSSLFAYVADGVNGLKVVQLFSPVDNPAFSGFSPRPTPKVIASYRTKGPALAISKGIDRDRAVDESGNQLAVFGRRGARPFNRQEMERMYLKDGKLFTVADEAPDEHHEKAHASCSPR
ncbi:MAG: LVIVD repeat-containing protein, partial [Terriglobales bacterium]